MDSPFFKGINPESTGAKVAGPEPSYTGPTGRKPTFDLCATDMADLTARAAVLQAWKSIAAVKNGFIVTQHRSLWPL